MKRIFLIALLVLSGCGEAAYRAEMEKFVGQPERALLAAKGAPSRAYDPGDGSRILTYDEHGIVGIGGILSSSSCSTSFMLDRARIVQSVALAGDSCGDM